QPKRSIVPHARVKRDAPLPDRRPTIIDAQAHALCSILEVDVGDPNLAAVSGGFPICFEVFTFKTSAANLLGKKPVLHGMVDVFEKLTIDPLIDRRRDSVCVHEQNNY